MTGTVVLLANDWEDLQGLTERHGFMEKIGNTARISIDKTKTMMNIEIMQPIILEREEMENVDRFSYLSSNISMNCETEKDLNVTD